MPTSHKATTTFTRTIKLNLLRFVKVDTPIDLEEECWRTMSYLQEYSRPKLYCKKLSNQNPTANTVRSRRTTLCWIRGKIKQLLRWRFAINALVIKGTVRRIETDWDICLYSYFKAKQGVWSFPVHSWQSICTRLSDSTLACLFPARLFTGVSIASHLEVVQFLTGFHYIFITHLIPAINPARKYVN